MTQQEFYNLPEVITCLDIQKQNPYGSDKHRQAYFAIAEIAKKHGVFDQYKAAGGMDY